MYMRLIMTELLSLEGVHGRKRKAKATYGIHEFDVIGGYSVCGAKYGA